MGPRRWRIAAVVAGFPLAGLLASACGGGGAALAQQACSHVRRSLELYASAKHAPSRTLAHHERSAALTELRLALRPASLAGSAGGAYQALQATLEESSRVPESYLVSALSAQCASITSSS